MSSKPVLPHHLTVAQAEAVLDELVGCASAAAVIFHHLAEDETDGYQRLDMPMKRAISWLEARLADAAENVQALVVGAPAWNTTHHAERIAATLAAARAAAESRGEMPPAQGA
jgi:hypothetical protein